MRDRLTALRAAIDLSNDPERTPLVLVRTLTAGCTALTVVGILGFLALGHEPALLALPAGASSIAIWGLVDLRRRHPRPVPMLVAVSLAGTGYLLAAMLTDDAALASNATPLVVVSAAGVIAFLAGGRAARRMLWAMLPLVAMAVYAAQMTIDGNPTAVAVDISAVIVILAITYRLAGQLSTTAFVSRDRFTTLLDTAPVAIFEADLSGMRLENGRPVGTPRFNEFNTRAAAIVDASLRHRTRDAGRWLAATFSPTAQSLVVDVLSKGSDVGSGLVDTPDGREFLVSWRIVDPSLERVMFCLMDNTPQRRATEALAEQVRSRDRFIASISHELRTPLTGALGLMEVIDDGDLGPGEEDELFDIALGQLRDLTDIVQDLLVAARADTGTLAVKPERIDLTQLTRGVLEGLDAPISLEPGPPVMVTADPVRVRQIVRNLVTNATRYGGPNRRILLDGGGLEVRDDGPEIDEAVVATMFEPYGRGGSSDTATDSVGLGLTVARTLARLMDGDVSYRRDGAESVFSLSLPPAE